MVRDEGSLCSLMNLTFYCMPIRILYLKCHKTRKSSHTYLNYTYMSLITRIFWKDQNFKKVKDK